MGILQCEQNPDGKLLVNMRTIFDVKDTQIFNYGSDYDNKYVYDRQRHLDEFPSLRLGVRGL